MGKLDKATTGGRSPQAAAQSPTQTSEERRWRAEDALRTATTHLKNTQDQTLMKDVQKLASEQMTHLACVAAHAGGATTQHDQRKDTRGKAGPPKAADKGGSSGGGSAKQGPRSQKTKK